MWVITLCILWHTHKLLVYNLLTEFSDGCTGWISHTHINSVVRSHSVLLLIASIGFTQLKIGILTTALIIIITFASIFLMKLSFTSALSVMKGALFSETLKNTHVPKELVRKIHNDTDFKCTGVDNPSHPFLMTYSKVQVVTFAEPSCRWAA